MQPSCTPYRLHIERVSARIITFMPFARTQRALWKVAKMNVTLLRMVMRKLTAQMSQLHHLQHLHKKEIQILGVGVQTTGVTMTVLRWDHSY